MPAKGKRLHPLQGAAFGLPWVLTGFQRYGSVTARVSIEGTPGIATPAGLQGGEAGKEAAKRGGNSDYYKRLAANAVRARAAKRTKV